MMGNPARIAIEVPSPLNGEGSLVLKSTPDGFLLNRFDLPEDKTTAFALKK